MDKEYKSFNRWFLAGLGIIFGLPITGLKIGAFVATIGLSILSKWIDTKEQKQEIEKAVGKYIAEHEIPKLN